MSKDGQGSHHILPYKTGAIVFAALIVFTVITVAVAQVDLGVLNFPVAMLIATMKALMVVLLFMGLLYDSNDNRIIFGTSFIFAAIFVVLTGMDLISRGDRRTKEGDFAPVASNVVKFKRPWNTNAEIVAHGKGLYDIQCVSCHGTAGAGDGIAAAALNPKPRNFTAGAGWKNGRKPSQVFLTLKNGLGSMPAFATLPSEDRWALAHYVATLGPSVLKDSDGDLAKAGVQDRNQDTSGAGDAKGLPIDAVIEMMATDGKL